LPWLWPILWFLGKTFVFLFIYVWLRAALPRMRYDQLMDLGWKGLIPLSLGWLLVIAGILLSPAWGFGVLGGCVVAGLILARALQVSHSRREDEFDEQKRVGPHSVREIVAISSLRSVPESDETGG
jgi:NADH-quinone oxidoreductase subunit H